MIKSRACLGEILLEEESSESEGAPKTSGNTKAEGSDAQVKLSLRSSIPTAGAPIKLADSRKRSRIELYKIIYSTSPKEFQVAPLVDVLPWDVELQKFYGDENNRKGFEIKTSCALAERLYACNWRSTWYRVKIVDVDLIREMANVYFIDFDKTQLVHMGSLLELCSEFWSWPASIYKAELLNVLPANGELHWSDGALREFQAICKPAKIFLGFIPEIQHTKLRQNSPLPLILFDVRSYDLTVSVQQRLIQGKFADSCNEMDLSKVFKFEETSLKVPAATPTTTTTT